MTLALTLAHSLSLAATLDNSAISTAPVSSSCLLCSPMIALRNWCRLVYTSRKDFSSMWASRPMKTSVRSLFCLAYSASVRPLALMPMSCLRIPSLIDWMSLLE